MFHQAKKHRGVAHRNPRRRRSSLVPDQLFASWAAAPSWSQLLPIPSGSAEQAESAPAQVIAPERQGGVERGGSWEEYATYKVPPFIQPLACSISEAHRAVLDSTPGLSALRLHLTWERAGHCPYPDDYARDDNGPCTRAAHATGSLHQTESSVTGLPPSRNGPSVLRRH